MNNIIVLYDGTCKLCVRSVRSLKKLDGKGVLQYIDFHDVEKKNAVAQDLRFADLDKAMHIKLPDGTFKKGFYAFRSICRALPLLMWLWPLLYIPGVPFIGTKVYSYIANHRQKCVGDDCKI